MILRKCADFAEVLSLYLALWRQRLDFLLLGYPLLAAHIWVRELRFEIASDKMLESEKLDQLEECRQYGRRLGIQEQALIKFRALNSQPIEDRWLIFGTRTVRERRGRLVIGHRWCDLLILQAARLCIGFATAYVVILHFSIAGDQAIRKLWLLPIELGFVVAAAYVWDLYLTRPLAVLKLWNLRCHAI